MHQLKYQQYFKKKLTILSASICVLSPGKVVIYASVAMPVINLVYKDFKGKLVAFRSTDIAKTTQTT